MTVEMPKLATSIHKKDETWFRSFLVNGVMMISMFFFAVGARAEDNGEITLGELIRRTQELYDAVAIGNREPWKQYFAEDCIYSDEKGRTLDKAKLIEDITPLPNGYFGAIKVEKPQHRIIGDTAILNYDLNEKETIFGQDLRARYHVTDTWLRRGGQWQIVASQSMRYYEDPAVGKIDRSKLDNYAGTYELAPGQTRMVTREGEKLFVTRKGKREELFPEARDIFFRKGVEGRILFRTNDRGTVDALIDRRNNEDVIWPKK
jgi:hypothetical protein